MKKNKIDALEAAKLACAAIPAPRTQAEWRRASNALRTVRRLTQPRKIGYTAKIECGGSHRYLHCDTWSSAAGSYNGAMGLGAVRWIQHHAFLYREGSTRGRVADARYFATVCRREGPVSLPDARPTVRTLLARHEFAYQQERAAKRNGMDAQTCAVLMRDREFAWRDVKVAMGGTVVEPAGEVECLAA